MKKTKIITIILGILVFISLVQAVQLNDIKTKIADGDLKVGSSTTTSSSGSSGSSSKSTGSVPKSIQNLPTMVGGC